ncbi:hypothetical protein F503_07065 [Ophiostoma piceae UAMH 11346]|uniref:DUF6604 domain-containing protein n=1 Tax=Ophiostoma piceae (strain UAMH 11346) TaxID=1262450 RepID=S3C6Z5_OPHP1|nr:hypothetical protein F503_07065 [Ophiostoma piceae UAMH 11346]
MLPEKLMSSYERYKHDTAVVSSWLVHTAKGHGYDKPLSAVASTSGNSASKPRSARLKGKARKEAAQAATRSANDTTVEGRVTKSTPARPRYQYILAIKDFVPLAEYILEVKLKKNEPFPLHIAQSLHRVIKSRRTFSSVLQTEAKGGLAEFKSDEVNDEKHSYFVSILEQVRKIFKPLMDKLDMADIQDALSESTSAANVFDPLLLYEPSEEFQEIPAKASDTEGTESDGDIPGPDYVAESADTAQDALFAFYALMQDAMALRKRVQGMWDMYKQGGIELAAISVATSTATSLVRQMEEEVTPLLRKNGGIQRFVHAYFMSMCAQMGLDYYKRERRNDSMNVAAYGPADHCFFIAHQCLDGYRRAHAPNSFQAYNGIFGYFDSRKDHSRLSNRDKYQQDQAGLLELLGEVSVMALAMKLPCEDELTAGVRLMVKGATQNETPLWVTFAAQACLDSMKCLSGPHADRPMKELIDWSRSIRETIESVLKLHGDKKIRMDTWPASNDAMIRDLAALAAYWDDDPIAVLKTRKNLPTRTPQAYLRRNAIFCGVWLHFIRARYHEAGTAMAMAWGTVVFMGQLYFAMRREGVMPADKKWYGMELLRMLQGDKGFYVGGPPATAEADFKNFCLFMGYSASNWVPPSKSKRNKGGKRAAASRAGPRSLSTQAPVTMLISEHLASGKGQQAAGGLSTSDVEKILEVSQWSQTMEADGKTALEKEPTSSKAAGKKDKNKGKDKEASLADFVLQLALAIQAEIPEVAFDYFKMHSDCWQMLFMIDMVIGERLSQIFAPDYLDNKETQLPFLVGYIFMASSGKETEGPGFDRLELMYRAYNAVDMLLPVVGDYMRGLLKLSNVQVDLEYEETDSEDE